MKLLRTLAPFLSGTPTLHINRYSEKVLLTDAVFSVGVVMECVIWLGPSLRKDKKVEQIKSTTVPQP